MKNDKTFILHVESSHPKGSVLLSRGSEIAFYAESSKTTSHHENLPVLIQEALNKTDIDASFLGAIHLCSGPGSYTGLRIGHSMVLGLAFGAHIPVIHSSANEILMSWFKEYHTGVSSHSAICTVINARPNEVYGQAFSHDTGHPINELGVWVINEDIFDDLKEVPLALIGSGVDHEGIPEEGVFFRKNLQVDALMMLSLGERKFRDGSFTALSQLTPLYLKPPRVIKSSKKLFG